MTENEKLLNYLRNMICGAKNGHVEDLAVLRNVLRHAPDNAPDAGLIRMAELLLQLGIEQEQANVTG